MAEVAPKSTSDCAGEVADRESGRHAEEMLKTEGDRSTEGDRHQHHGGGEQNDETPRTAGSGNLLWPQPTASALNFGVRARGSRCSNKRRIEVRLAHRFVFAPAVALEGSARLPHEGTRPRLENAGKGTARGLQGIG